MQTCSSVAEASCTPARTSRTLRVSAVPAVHRQFLFRCQPLDGSQGTPVIPAQRKARREYENRVNALQAATAGP